MNWNKDVILIRIMKDYEGELAAHECGVCALLGTRVGE